MENIISRTHMQPQSMTHNHESCETLSSLSQIRDTSTIIRHFWEMVLTQFSVRIKRWHSDQGTEYLNKDVSEFLKTKGVIHTTSPPYNPESNGVAERINRT